ncbi:muts domain V-domain-containing protein [Blastocladiella britannica]|nr:muts domain V-domain-containing protein [Blastocladiella britannica]
MMNSTPSRPTSSWVNNPARPASRLALISTAGNANTSTTILSVHYDHDLLGISLYAPDQSNGTLFLGTRDDPDPAPYHDLVLAVAAQHSPTVILVSATAPPTMLALLERDRGNHLAQVVIEPRPQAHYRNPFARTRVLTEVVNIQHRRSTSSAIMADPMQSARATLAEITGSQPEEIPACIASASALCEYLSALRDSIGAPLEPGEASDDTANVTASRHTFLSRFGIADPELESIHTDARLTRHLHLPLDTAASTAPTLGARNFHVCRLAPLNLADTMELEPAAMESLGLFTSSGSTQAHAAPSGVFELLDHTRTRHGRALLRRWISCPLHNQEKIERRLQTVSALLHAQNRATVQVVRGSLVHVRDMTALLSRPILAHTHWRSLQDTADAAAKIVEALAHFQPAPGTTADQLDPELVELVGESANTYMEACREALYLISPIDMECSRAENRVVIKPGIDPALGDIKTKYDALPEYLRDLATECSQGLPDSLAEHLLCLYIPQIGYLAAISRNILAEYASTLPTPLSTLSASSDPQQPQQQSSSSRDFLTPFAIPGLELAFATSSNVYFKGPLLRDLDIELGDLFGMIVDREIELVFELREAMRHLEPVLRVLDEHLATLDAHLALAEVAEQYGYSMPTIVEPGSPLYLPQARHPLLEHVIAYAGETYIPNDISLGSTKPDATAPRLAILTGPNASGKSALLHTAALIVVMAHIGSYVPTDAGATIPLTDGVLMRITSHESASIAQSAFLIELEQMSYILRRATRDSLIVIDEFGKGTCAPDGMGMFAACIEYLACRGPDAPLTLVATHFHGLFEQEILCAGIEMELLSMRVLNGGGNEVPVCLYQTVAGRADGSLALQCARAAGIPSSILNRAMDAEKAIRDEEPYIQQSPYRPEPEKALLQLVKRFTCSPNSIRDYGSAEAAAERVMEVYGQTRGWPGTRFFKDGN